MFTVYDHVGAFSTIAITTRDAACFPQVDKLERIVTSLDTKSGDVEGFVKAFVALRKDVLQHAGLEENEFFPKLLEQLTSKVGTRKHLHT